MGCHGGQKGGKRVYKVIEFMNEILEYFCKIFVLISRL